MEIIINLDKEDWRKYISLFHKKLAKAISPWRGKFWLRGVFWLELFAGSVIGFVFMMTFLRRKDFHWPTAELVVMFFVVMIAVCLLKYFMLQKELRRKCEPSDEGIFVGEHKFIFDEEGIQSQGKGYKSSLAWSVVRKIERGRGMILVYQDTENAYVFPESKLDNPNEFYNFITEQYSKTMGERTLDQF